MKSYRKLEKESMLKYNIILFQRGLLNLKEGGRMNWLILDEKVYKVQRKDTGEFFAVKYLHKRKMKEIEDSEVSTKKQNMICSANRE